MLLWSRPMVTLLQLIQTQSALTETEVGLGAGREIRQNTPPPLLLLNN